MLEQELMAFLPLQVLHQTPARGLKQSMFHPICAYQCPVVFRAVLGSLIFQRPILAVPPRKSGLLLPDHENTPPPFSSCQKSCQTLPMCTKRSRRTRLALYLCSESSFARTFRLFNVVSIMRPLAKAVRICAIQSIISWPYCGIEAKNRVFHVDCFRK